ncbi:hypothetical protein ACGFNU_32590 [Spirillospora sp. NPDC048911]|uniref:hypothetical protein n=1 Tax=Spirillospora sp. NPDC048911 TaxID=3364527 RepID=UPI0037226DC0
MLAGAVLGMAAAPVTAASPHAPSPPDQFTLPAPTGHRPVGTVSMHLAKFWADQRGPKLQLKLAGAAHGTFLDFAVLLPQAARVLDIPPEDVAKAAGTIEGERAAAVVRAYVNAYFDQYLRHRHSALLDGPSSRYPEVKFTP